MKSKRVQVFNVALEEIGAKQFILRELSNSGRASIRAFDRPGEQIVVWADVSLKDEEGRFSEASKHFAASVVCELPSSTEEVVELAIKTVDALVACLKENIAAEANVPLYEVLKT